MEGFPLPKFYNVPIYEEGVVLRWVTPDEAFELSGRLYPSGAPMYEIRDDKLRPWREELHKLVPAKDNNNFSPCSISFSETKANVGEVKAAIVDDADETKRNASRARAEVRRAQRKVFEWPREGRDREGYYRAITIVPKVQEGIR